MKFLAPIALISLTIGPLCEAEPVRLLDCAPHFRSKTVLQQGVAVPVWGRAVAGSEVTVTFAGQSHSPKPCIIALKRSMARTLVSSRL